MASLQRLHPLCRLDLPLRYHHRRHRRRHLPSHLLLLLLPPPRRRHSTLPRKDLGILNYLSFLLLFFVMMDAPSDAGILPIRHRHHRHPHRQVDAVSARVMILGAVICCCHFGSIMIDSVSISYPLCYIIFVTTTLVQPQSVTFCFQGSTGYVQCVVVVDLIMPLCTHFFGWRLDLSLTTSESCTLYRRKIDTIGGATSFCP